MSSIPIRSCHNCEPGKWIVQDESEGTYKCKCGKIIRVKLKDRYYQNEVMKKCEFYPTEPDEPVCDCGSDICGPTFVCTKQYSLTCQWAKERRKEDGRNIRRTSSPI